MVTRVTQRGFQVRRGLNLESEVKSNSGAVTRNSSDDQRCHAATPSDRRIIKLMAQDNLAEVNYRRGQSEVGLLRCREKVGGNTNFSEIGECIKTAKIGGN